MLLNLRVKPSPLFVPSSEEEEIDFNWHCKSGLAKNIQLVKDEFCKERGLKPFKVFMCGPPAIGKSFFSAQIAENYNISHIHIKKMIDEIVNWNKEKE